jgi:hypothetical protein
MKISDYSKIEQIQESNQRAAGFDQHQDRMNRSVKPLPAKVNYSFRQNKGNIRLKLYPYTKILCTPYLK